MEIYVRVNRGNSSLRAMSTCTLIGGLILIGNGLVDKETGAVQIIVGSIFLILNCIYATYTCKIWPEPVQEVQHITIHQAPQLIIEHTINNPMMGCPAEKSDAQTDCCVCMDARRSIAFIPCGHSVCGSCDGKLTLCPVCRTPIADRLRLY